MKALLVVLFLAVAFAMSCEKKSTDDPTNPDNIDPNNKGNVGFYTAFPINGPMQIYINNKSVGNLTENNSIQYCSSAEVNAELSVGSYSYKAVYVGVEVAGSFTIAKDKCTIVKVEESASNPFPRTLQLKSLSQAGGQDHSSLNNCVYTSGYGIYSSFVILKSNGTFEKNANNTPFLISTKHYSTYGIDYYDVNKCGLEISTYFVETDITEDEFVKMQDDRKLREYRNTLVNNAPTQIKIEAGKTYAVANQNNRLALIFIKEIVRSNSTSEAVMSYMIKEQQ